VTAALRAVGHTEGHHMAGNPTDPATAVRWAVADTDRHRAMAVHTDLATEGPAMIAHTDHLATARLTGLATTVASTRMMHHRGD